MALQRRRARSFPQPGKAGKRSREQVTHLLHAPFGHVFGREPRDLRQELAVLLPAEMEPVGRVRGQGRHEDGLVEGLLEIQIRVWKGNETSQDQASSGSNYSKAGGRVTLWRETQGRASTATARHAERSGRSSHPPERGK